MTETARLHTRAAWVGFLVAGSVLLCALTWAPAIAVLVAALLMLPVQLAASAWGLHHAESRASRWRFCRDYLLLLLPAAGSAAVLAAAAAWPLRELASAPTLGSVLLLSAIVGAAWVALSRVWPMFVLALVDSEPDLGLMNCWGRVRLASQKLVSEDPSPIRPLIAALTLLLLLCGTLSIAALMPLVLPWRLAFGLAWVGLVAPFLCMVLLALVEPARLAAYRIALPVLPERHPQSRHGSIVLPVDLDARLYACARLGKIDESIGALDAGANPNALPAPGHRDQRTIAMVASVQADTRLLRRLIGAGVDLNRVHGGLTPLLAATRDSLLGRPEAVMTLLTNGADPRAVDAEGRCALHFAALASDPAIAALLLDAGAAIDLANRDGFSALGVAAGAGNWSMMKFLLDRGAKTAAEGAQPALLAAASGDDDPAGVQLLLRHRARVDARGRLGRTALMHACLADNPEIVRCLLAAGADAHLGDDHGVTALHEAARAGASRVLDQFRGVAVEPNAVDSGGRNALIVACQSTRADAQTIAVLLDLGVLPLQPALDLRTALDCAVQGGRWNLVAILDPAQEIPTSVCSTGVDGAIDPGAGEPLLERFRQACMGTDLSLVSCLLTGLAEADLKAFHAWIVENRGELPDPVWPRVFAALTSRYGESLALDLFRSGNAPAIASAMARGLPLNHGGDLAELLRVASATPIALLEVIALDLLQRGGDASGSVDGTPPLHTAITLGACRLVRVLLARGADPECRDARGNSALQLACRCHRDDLVPHLLRAGAQPQRPNPAGETAYGLALASGHDDLVEWLQWNQWCLPGRRLRGSDLVAAAAVGDLTAVDRLLVLGLDINAVDEQGATALIRASGNGHREVVAFLLDQGADPLRLAEAGASCLSAAISTRRTPIVELLLSRGVPIEQRLAGGITPLMIAAALGLPEMLQLLGNNGADVAATDSRGNTAAHALAQFGCSTQDWPRIETCWTELLRLGADIDHRGEAELTPLLLLLGAKTDLGSNHDESCIAAQVEILLKRNPDLNVRDVRGFTPLHLAVVHGHLRSVRSLLAAGADRNARDQLNRRPQEVALMRGFVDIADEVSPSADAEASISVARLLRDSGRGC